jgi:hypothetical protein
LIGACSGIAKGKGRRNKKPNSKIKPFEMSVSYLGGRRHLPIIELRKAA